MSVLELIKPKQKAFLSSPRFAVVGASKDPKKFGTKVLKWYQAQGKEVTPVHPKEAEIEGLSTVTSVSALPAPSETSLSIVTPPKITLGVLEQAKASSIPAIWLQPGAEDDNVINWIRENGFEERVIYNGPCLLAEGDGIVNSLL